MQARGGVRSGEDVIMTEIGLLDAMYTARALRRLEPDPVPKN